MDRLNEALKQGPKSNSMIIGPEPTGCMNSGFAPVIGNYAKYFRLGAYPPSYEENKKVGWVVGSEMYVAKAVYYAIGKERDKLGFWIEQPIEVNDRFMLFKGGTGRKVWMYQTRKPAIKRFRELVLDRLAENNGDLDTIKGLRKLANKGDMQAVLDLAEYGNSFV